MATNWKAFWERHPVLRTIGELAVIILLVAWYGLDRTGKALWRRLKQVISAIN